MKKNLIKKGPILQLLFILTLTLLPGVSAWADKRVEKDLDNDGRPDQVLTYNDAGVILKVESDKDQDGFFESLQHYQEGKLVRIERDTDNDQKTDCIDYIENEKRTRQEKFDARGNLIQVSLFDGAEQITLMKKDTTGDRKFDTLYHFKAGVLSSSTKDTDANEKPNVFCAYKNQMPTEQRVDDNEDGIMDKVLVFNTAGELEKLYKDPYAKERYRITVSFEKGEIISQERDRNEDGKPDDITLFKKGTASEQKKDSNFDGRFDTFTVFMKGLPKTQEKDSNFDGKMDYFAEFDDKGEVLKTREDTNENGKPDRTRHYRAGSLYKMESDANDDEFFETVSLLENNRITKTLIDRNQDGKADMEVFFNGNQEKKRLISDADFDGYFETTQVYDNPAWTTIVALDSDGDKTPDIRSYYKDTVLRQKEIDENGDGVMDLVEVFNPKGELERVEEKKAGKTALTWFYGKGEVLLRGEEDKNQDGKTEIWYIYENGKLKTVEEDTNFDGKPDLWEEYDDIEALVKRSKDLDFDGTPDFTDVVGNAEKDS
ncbi:MAG: hypothetical protein NDI81_14045 [Desulfobacula sp.]|nr:hypothetical protein [Desulfobacula sp.]